MDSDQEIQIVKLLAIEDNPEDALNIKRLLSDKNINSFYAISFKVNHVDRLSKGIDFSKKDNYDVILLDFDLPDGSGMDLVKKMRGQRITVPIVILTGYNCAKTALEALRKGAQDYLSKDTITSENLIRTLCYAIERQKLKNELTEARERIDTLHGMLPICCKCKQFRDDDGYWHQIESYIKSHIGVSFSHGYCPSCYEKEMEEFEKVNKLI